MDFPVDAVGAGMRNPLTVNDRRRLKTMNCRCDSTSDPKSDGHLFSESRTKNAIRQSPSSAGPISGG